MNSILIERITVLTAQIMYQSYNSVTLENAFCMALGEAEVEFDADLDIELTEGIRNKIESKIKQ